MKFSNYYKTLNPELKNYHQLLHYEIPDFLISYLETSTLKRLQKVGYFCGKEKFNKDLYQFKYYLSRFDHSLSTALIIWHFTNNKQATLAALFHDASTPAFSHIIDYLNEDYEFAESTELDLNIILSKDQDLLSLLKKDSINLEDISIYKKYSLVDNKRPKLCADRIDGIFLTNLIWTKKTDLEEIALIYNDLKIDNNQDLEAEFNFSNSEKAQRLVELNNYVNDILYTKYDHENMIALANIVKRLIEMAIISYDDLFIITDDYLYYLINKYSQDKSLNELLKFYYNIKKTDKKMVEGIKNRDINPLILTKRYYHLIT